MRWNGYWRRIWAWGGDNGENRRPLQWRIVSNPSLPFFDFIPKFALPTPRILVMEWIASPEAWIALFTLTVLEIVLGIDNIIFISILVDRLPEHQQKKARLTGLALAMVLRILLLLFHQLGDGADQGFVRRRRPWVFRARFRFSSWRSVPHLEIHAGNPSLAFRQPEEEQSTTVATYGSVLAQIAVWIWSSHWTP